MVHAARHDVSINYVKRVSSARTALTFSPAAAGSASIYPSFFPERGSRYDQAGGRKAESQRGRRQPRRESS